MSSPRWLTILAITSIALFQLLATARAATPTPSVAQVSIVDLGRLGGNRSLAYDINESGQIVGASTMTLGLYDRQAFLWEDGVMTDLWTLGGEISIAIGINDAGQIAGASTTAHGQDLGGHGTHAVLRATDPGLTKATGGSPRPRPARQLDQARCPPVSPQDGWRIRRGLAHGVTTSRVAGIPFTRERNMNESK